MGICYISCLSQIQTFHCLGPKLWCHPCFLSLSIQQDILLGLCSGYTQNPLCCYHPGSSQLQLSPGAQQGPPLCPLLPPLADILPLSGNFHHGSQREAVLKSQITFPSPSSTQNLSMASQFSQSKLTNPSCGLSRQGPQDPALLCLSRWPLRCPRRSGLVCPSIIHPWCGSSPCLGCSSLRWARGAFSYLLELCAQL